MHFAEEGDSQEAKAVQQAAPAAVAAGREPVQMLLGGLRILRQVRALAFWRRQHGKWHGLQRPFGRLFSVAKGSISVALYMRRVKS